MTGARFSKISQALKFRTNIPHLKINMQVSVLFTGNKNRFWKFLRDIGKKSMFKLKKQSRPEIKNERVSSTKIETVVNRCKSSVTRGRTMIKRISPTIVDMYFHLFSVVIFLFLPLLLAPFLPSFLFYFFLAPFLLALLFILHIRRRERCLRFNEIERRHRLFVGKMLIQEWQVRRISLDGRRNKYNVRNGNHQGVRNAEGRGRRHLLFVYYTPLWRHYFFIFV